jgi:hypothetical protein
LAQGWAAGSPAFSAGAAGVWHLRTEVNSKARGSLRRFF